jgi:hypothetical protein
VTSHERTHLVEVRGIGSRRNYPAGTHSIGDRLGFLQVKVGDRYADHIRRVVNKVIRRAVAHAAGAENEDLHKRSRCNPHHPSTVFGKVSEKEVNPQADRFHQTQRFLGKSNAKDR